MEYDITLTTEGGNTYVHSDVRLGCILIEQGFTYDPVVVTPQEARALAQSLRDAADHVDEALAEALATAPIIGNVTTT